VEIVFNDGVGYDSENLIQWVQELWNSFNHLIVSNSYEAMS